MSWCSIVSFFTECREIFSWLVLKQHSRHIIIFNVFINFLERSWIHWSFISELCNFITILFKVMIAQSSKIWKWFLFYLWCYIWIVSIWSVWLLVAILIRASFIPWTQTRQYLTLIQIYNLMWPSKNIIKHFFLRYIPLVIQQWPLEFDFGTRIQDCHLFIAQSLFAWRFHLDIVNMEKIYSSFLWYIVACCIGEALLWRRR